MKNARLNSALLKELALSEEAKLDGYRVDFAVALQDAMRRQSMRKTDLASALHTSAPYVSKLLRGDANCTIDTMGRAAHAVGGRLKIAIEPVVESFASTGPTRIKFTTSTTKWRGLAGGRESLVAATGFQNTEATNGIAA